MSDDDDAHYYETDGVDSRYDQGLANARGGGGKRRGRGGANATTSNAAPAAAVAGSQPKPQATSSETIAASAFLPADKAIQRVLTDSARFDAAKILVGFTDRFSSELRFHPVLTFRGAADTCSSDPASGIPLHRVQQLVHADSGEVLYDRQARVNRLSDAPVLFNPVAAAAKPKPAAVQASIRHVKGLQLHVVPSTAPPLATTHPEITFLNFNVLHDLFDKDKIFTAQRMPLVIRVIEESNADIVFLQEMTAGYFNEFQRRSPMLCARYHWTTVPSDSQSIQVTLSKFPVMAAVSHALSRNKRCVFAMHQLPDSTELVTANCHLLSDFGNDPINRRLGEINQIFDLLHRSNAAAFVMSGDFNFGDQNPEQRIVKWRGMSDAWLEVRGATSRFDGTDTVVVAEQTPAKRSVVEGFTYDLTRNWLADAMSLAHRYPRRLDRTLLHGLRPLACRVVADVPSTDPDVLRHTGGRPLFPSDHFGLFTTCGVDPDYRPRTDAAVDGAREAQPVGPWTALLGPALVETGLAARIAALSSSRRNFRSALVVLVPDHPYVPVINEMRQQFDKAYPRWMPHVTLMFPFVEIALFPDAIGLVEEALRIARSAAAVALKPFTVRLARTGSFGGGGKKVLFVDCEEAQANTAATPVESAGLQTLNRFLEPLFPALKREDRDGFKPHVTLGQCSATQERALRTRFEARWQEVVGANTDFTIADFALIAHFDDRPGYEVIHRFALQ